MTTSATLEQAVATTIREIRVYRNLQVKQLADRVPMCRSYLSEIENGHKIPSIGLLSEIAKGLDVEVAELWYEIYRNLGGE